MIPNRSDDRRGTFAGDRGISSVPFRVTEYIRKHDMLRPGDRVMAAVSGGADSVCMLKILDLIKEDLEISLFVLHVNHHLREDAEKDADFVRELARRLGLDFILKDVDMPGEARRLGLSEEEAGRNLRYQALREGAREKGCGKIAIAHNAGDLAETMIMNLLRGSGLKGLTGIRPVRDEMIRPILFLEREEIEAYLGYTGTEWVTDKTNESPVFTRNRIRNTAIPWAEENVSPRLIPRLAATSEILTDIQAHLEKEASALIRSGFSKGYIDSEVFLSADKAVTREALLRILEGKTPHRKDITSRHIEILMNFMADTRGSADLDLPYGLRARREYGKVFIFREGEEPGYSPVPTCKTLLDCDKMTSRPVWRTRAPGDHIVKKNGRKTSIKKLFIDLKIPKAQRDHIPLLCCGSEVIWIPGLDLKSRFAADPGSVDAQEYSWPQGDK